MTLRARLALSLAAAVVILVGAGGAILGLVRTSLVAELDAQLAAATRLIAGPVGLQVRETLPPPVPIGSDADGTLTDLYLAVVQPDGAVVVVIHPVLGSGAEPELDGTAVRARATDASRPDPFSVTSSDGMHGFRVASVHGLRDETVVVALPSDRIDGTFQRVEIGVLVAGALLLVALAVASWWVERLGLRPIRRVTDAADAIAAGDLDRRVTMQSSKTEAGRLAQAFNVMVDERQASEDRLRRFIADASHELRTPLTTVVGVLELHRSGVLEGADLGEALRRAHLEARRMTGLVEDLLLLARLDDGRPLASEPVDLTRLVADAALDATLIDADRSIVIDAPPAAIVPGDEARLRQVVGNLVANALAYGDPGGEIRLHVRRDRGVCVLEVADDGPGMTAGQAAHVFERFYRIDEGRARRQGGSGLGLSIVQSIVVAHHGSITVDAAPGHGATFRVVLPSGPIDTEDLQATSSSLAAGSEAPSSV